MKFKKSCKQSEDKHYHMQLIPHIMRVVHNAGMIKLLLGSDCYFPVTLFVFYIVNFFIWRAFHLACMYKISRNRFLHLRWYHALR